MELIINNPDDEDLDDFAIWLCLYIRNEGLDIAKRDLSLESLWDGYFKEVDWGWTKDAKGNPLPPSTNFILNTYFNNITIRKNGSDYTITCRDDVDLPNSEVSLDMIANAINSGTLSFPHPYKCIETIYQAAADSLEDLYDIFQSGLDEEEEDKDEVDEEELTEAVVEALNEVIGNEHDAV